MQNIVHPFLLSAGLAICFAALRRTIVKRISIITAALLLAVACKVEKTGKDTYKVVAPTPAAKAAAKKAEEKAKQLTNEASEAIKKKTEGSKTETTATTESTTSGTTQTTETHTKKRH